MHKDLIHRVEDVPAGYFRIHWPQYQVLMDEPGYDDDVLHCEGKALIEGLSTIALPYSYMEKVEELLSKRTRFYFEFINQKKDLN